MSILPSLGACGIGLVWGWLLGSLDGQVRHIASSILSLAGATLVLGGSVVVLYGWSLALLTAVAAGVTLIFHLGWRQELRRRRS